MEFKYIIINRVKVVLFSHGIEHIDEANGRNVTSAGFVRITTKDNNISVKCFGHSDSLGIKSDPARDGRVIYVVAKNSMGTGAE